LASYERQPVTWLLEFLSSSIFSMSAYVSEPPLLQLTTTFYGMAIKLIFLREMPLASVSFSRQWSSS